MCVCVCVWVCVCVCVCVFHSTNTYDPSSVHFSVISLSILVGIILRTFEKRKRNFQKFFFLQNLFFCRNIFRPLIHSMSLHGNNFENHKK